MPVVCDCGCVCGRCSAPGCDCECHDFDSMTLSEIKDMVCEVVGLPPNMNHFACAKSKNTLFLWIRDQCTSSQIKKLLKLARARDSCPAYSFVLPLFKAGTTKTGIKKRRVSNTYAKAPAKKAKQTAKKRACATNA